MFQDFFFNSVSLVDYPKKKSDPSNSALDSSSPAGTVPKKKPLPDIPNKNNTNKPSTTSSDKRNSTLILSDNSNKGYVITGPSWITTQNNENRQDGYHLTESPRVMHDAIQVSSRTTGHEFTQQFDNPMRWSQQYGSTDYSNSMDHRRSLYTNPSYQQMYYYPYPQQPYWNPQQLQDVGCHFQNQHNTLITSLPSSVGGRTSEPITEKDIVIGTNEEWKTSTKNNQGTVNQCIGRSDSLKIETASVPFSKTGGILLETHLQKPYEPPTNEIENTTSRNTINKEPTLMLQRKISKEEMFGIPGSVLLEKLDRSQHQQAKDMNSVHVNTTTTFFHDHNNHCNSSSSSSSSSGTESGSISTPVSVSSFSYHSTSAHPLQTSISASNLQLYNRNMQKHSNSMPLLTTRGVCQNKLEEEMLEDPAASFSAAERFFQQPSPVSRIPSPWGTSDSKSLSKERPDMGRISTGSIPNLAVCTAQVPDEISLESSVEIKEQSTESTSKAEQYFNVHNKNNHGNDKNKQKTDDAMHSDLGGSKHSLSIASCSLINIKSNTKLYRRMAIKTHDKEVQLTYAKYLLQISKLYDKNANKCIINTMNTSPSTTTGSKQHAQETPAQTRHRLLAEAGYWIERLAKAGKPEALFIKGRWYLLGPQAEDCVLHGYEKVEEAKAFKCFLRASKAGWTEAHYELANLWKKRGQYNKAIQCYDKGAKENHTLSIYVSFKSTAGDSYYTKLLFPLSF